jgi:hypothetical protein
LIEASRVGGFGWLLGFRERVFPDLEVIDSLRTAFQVA